MQILEQVEVKLNWMDFNNLHEHPYPKHKRSKGIHVTDILRKIAIKNKELTEREVAEEFAPLRVFLGIAWEASCVRLYPQILWQPGELKRDGIIGSPDGECHVPVQEMGHIPHDLIVAIEEFKYTAKSIREPGGGADSVRDITKDWLWRNQVLAYLAMHPEEPTLVRWHICYARGNYDFATGMQERYVRYLVRAERREIENCWTMIKKNKYIV